MRPPIRTALAITATLLAVAGCASQHAKATTHRTATPTATATGYTDGGGYACDQTQTDNLGNCPENPAYAAASASPTPSGPAMLAVGDTETLGDDSDNTIGTVTVESVHVTTWPAQAYGSGPANGYFVVVHVKATADPAYSDGFNINELDFYDLTRGQHYDSSSGNAYDALSDRQANADITATLAAGETASGWMAFDVPSRHGKIVYSPNSDGQPVAEWSY